MSFKFITLAASLVFLLTSGAGQAKTSNPLPTASDKLVRFGADVEGWTVYKNETRGDCLIVANFDDGAVQMGVTNDSDHVGYMGVFTKKDIGVKNGRESEIFISIDGRLYAGVGTGLSGHIKGGYQGGYIKTTPLFVRDVAKRYKMIVFPDTVGAFVVDLKGTFNALRKARECFAS